MDFAQAVEDLVTQKYEMVEEQKRKRKNPMSTIYSSKTKPVDITDTLSIGE